MVNTYGRHVFFRDYKPVGRLMIAHRLELKSKAFRRAEYLRERLLSSNLPLRLAKPRRSVMPLLRCMPSLICFGALLRDMGRAAIIRLPAVSSLKIAVVDYRVPELSLIRTTEKSVDDSEFDDGRPVFMNFHFFTSCPVICPLLR